jgi:hypothetical protein
MLWNNIILSGVILLIDANSLVSSKDGRLVEHLLEPAVHICLFVKICVQILNPIKV